MKKVYLPESYGKFVEVDIPNNAMVIGICRSLGEEIIFLESFPSSTVKDLLTRRLQSAFSETESLTHALPQNIFGIFYTPDNIGSTHSIVRLKGSCLFTVFESWTDEGTVKIIMKEDTGVLVPRKQAYKI